MSPQALRIMGYQLRANREWVGASGDVSLAFLNSDMPPSQIVLLEPPSALKRLGLVPPGIIWEARKHIYGLKRNPKAWGNLRDNTIDKKILETASGKVEIKLVPDEGEFFHFVEHFRHKNHRSGSHTCRRYTCSWRGACSCYVHVFYKFLVS